MSISKDKAQELALKWLQGKANLQEEKELFDWYNSHQAGEEFFEVLAPGDEDELREKMLAKLTKEMETIPVIKTRRKAPAYIWYSAAASVILLLFLTVRDGNSRFEKRESTPATVATLAPGASRAVLTLADGQQVFLDEINNGTIGKQKDITIAKKDGQIYYQGKEPSDTTMYNSVATPRQGQYELVLADGTRVWLDAASSIRFPVSFNGSTRSVELTGQAYFEVAHDKQHPFIVHVVSNNSDVKVLGTKFNIMSYKEETAVRTTLLEGAVKVTDTDDEVLLQPGEQSAISYNSIGKGNILVQKANVEQVVAWKNGKFHLGNTSIEELMRQVARWYDADIVYKGSLEGMNFSGLVSRTGNLTELLQLLEATGTVRFEVDGRKITVIGD